MVISEPGLICLDASEYRLVRGFAALWFGPRDSLPDRADAGSARPPVRVEPALAAPLTVTASQGGLAGPAEGHLQAGEESGLSDVEASDNAAPLTAQERRARSAALRGLLLSRQRRFARAQAAFTEAARLDPALSLESVPTFWDLERGAHEAAVRAYYEVGRSYEASMLASRLRTTFRPRLLGSRSGTPSPIS